MTLEVFDILGNIIEILESSYKIKGSYQVEFSGSGIASGMYFVSLKTPDYNKIIKIMLQK